MITKSIFYVLLCLLMLGCEPGKSLTSEEPLPEPPIEALKALNSLEVTERLLLRQGQNVTIVGITDAAEGSVTFQWKQVTGDPIDILLEDNPAELTVLSNDDTPFGYYIFELKVVSLIDGTELTASTEIKVYDYRDPSLADLRLGDITGRDAHPVLLNTDKLTAGKEIIVSAYTVGSADKVFVELSGLSEPKKVELFDDPQSILAEYSIFRTVFEVPTLPFTASVIITNFEGKEFEFDINDTFFPNQVDTEIHVPGNLSIGSTPYGLVLMSNYLNEPVHVDIELTSDLVFLSDFVFDLTIDAGEVVSIPFQLMVPTILDEFQVVEVTAITIANGLDAVATTKELEIINEKKWLNVLNSTDRCTTDIPIVTNDNTMEFVVVHPDGVNLSLARVHLNGRQIEYKHEVISIKDPCDESDVLLQGMRIIVENINVLFDEEILIPGIKIVRFDAFTSENNYLANLLLEVVDD